MVISFYMKGNNKSTKYELVESLAPSSKILRADSMDGTIGDIFNKEVNDTNIQDVSMLSCCSSFNSWIYMVLDVYI